ncbi:HK97 gp10 family phage protein [Neorhizobium alkalisoli]|uniref:Bacteriophage HK97-gp10 putative tail-component n=1 Tax=Neorhizobium alkalisoli TaxID=528178 RepID=A0A561QS90_9HYPH|nr:HK97 gp10 family phage protein [Neorhizobium alkalisoli]TWF53263.1 bacteriophage HK97-gp10 putative tail-component [Neorhizobium alkalisoli]
MAKILNLARLERKLRRLPKLVVDNIRSEMEAVADDIVAMMKNLVPVESGALRESIGWTWGKAPKGSMVLATAKASLGADLTITIYAGNDEAYWARWVEFGTAPHINKGLYAGSQNPGTRAQPFFYVSWRANKKPAKRAIRKATRNAARAVAAGK